MINLEIKNLKKVYNQKTVLNDLNFEVNNGEFLSILGPSGCGKTTLLKILIGIEKATSGTIIKDGKDITNLDASKREMGIVFQRFKSRIRIKLKLKLKKCSRWLIWKNI